MKKRKLFQCGIVALVLVVAVAFAINGFASETAGEAAAQQVITDTNPAIYVTQKTANSVVGVITNSQTWNRSTGETEETMLSQGSGVVIKEGGYILTNYHVIEEGSSYQVLMPSGEKVNAKLVGSDSSTDLAVLQVEEGADTLVPVEIGSSSSLPVGSTIIAIGNPGGEVLANTVTQGIVSALERDVDGNNTTREIAYIQHDAAINSGNSGGGLFNVNGELVGINTLKYSGSVYSSVTFEGLGFAIPVDTAYPIAMDLIEYGKVLRPQLGVTVADWSGPDEPLNNYPPASVCIYSVTEGGPAAEAGLKAYDFITEIDGVRVTSLRELTTQLDQHQEGDTVTITVVRYNNPAALGLPSYGMTDGSDGSADDAYGNYGGYYFYGGRNAYSNSLGGYETLTFDVTLKVLED